MYQPRNSVKVKQTCKTRSLDSHFRSYCLTQYVDFIRLGVNEISQKKKKLPIMHDETLIGSYNNCEGESKREIYALRYGNT